MKYLITESQFDKVIFKYLDNQDFKNVFYGHNIYFVNSKEDEYAQIKFNYTSKWCTVSEELMNEVSNFFSLINADSISAINKWVENKLGEEFSTSNVERNIIVHYF